MTKIIVIAQGIEIRDVGQGFWLQKFLADNCDRKGPAPAAGADNTWLFPKGSGKKATHEIRVRYAMGDLASALDLPDALVVYEGHSRYGQGPAFGPAKTPKNPDKKTFPVNPWGIHFRMGYEATDTECIGDIFDHSVQPVEHDLTTVAKGDFLPTELVKAAKAVQVQAKAIKAKKIKAVRACALVGAWREMDVCQPTLAADLTLRGDKPLSGRHFYKHEDWKKPPEFLTAVKVGSADLDKSKLACSLFFMASCSSKVHFHAALVRHRKKVKSSCKFLLTGQVCATSHATTFLRLVLLAKHDPMSAKGLEKIRAALDGEQKSGGVKIY